MNRTALVVYFNNPYPQNIGKIRKIYGERFSNLVFLTPIVGAADADADCFTGYRGGFTSYAMIADAEEFLLRREADTYIFMADDVLLNPKIDERNAAAIFKLDECEAFIPEFSFLTGKCNRRTRSRFFVEGAGGAWPWTPRILSRMRTKDFFFGVGTDEKFLAFPDPELARRKFARYGEPTNQIRSVFATRDWEFLLRRILRIPKLHTVPFPLAYGISDIFAIRRSVLPWVAPIFGMMGAFDIFIEVGVPTGLILATETLATWETADVDFLWDWTDDGQPVVGPIYDTLAEAHSAFNDAMLFIHPVKLSRFAV